MACNRVKYAGKARGQSQNTRIEWGDKVIGREEHDKPLTPYESDQHPSQVPKADIKDIKTNFGILG